MSTVMPFLYLVEIQDMPPFLNHSNHNDERYFRLSINEKGEIQINEVQSSHELSIPKKLEEYDILSVANDNFIARKFDGEMSVQRIFYSKESLNDPLVLLRLISANIKHGTKDDNLSVSEAFKELGRRNLSLTCGSASVFVKSLLDDIGIRSRVATSLTLNKWNEYDNGHTFLEVFFPKYKKWGVVDIDADRYFTLADGRPASVWDIANGGFDSIIVNVLSQDPWMDYSGFEEYQFFGEFVESNVEDWYRRVLQAVAIYDDTENKYLFPENDKKIADRIKSYSVSYDVVSNAEFKNNFYLPTHAR